MAPIAPKVPIEAARTRRDASALYIRVQQKLGVTALKTDHDLARLVEERLPVSTIDALLANGLSDEEVYTSILPRRTLAHRKSKHELLSHEESDRAVRIARITALAEGVFGDAEKANRWLRKPKTRFEGRTPMEVIRTEAGSRLVEEMIFQIDYGFFA